MLLWVVLCLTGVSLSRPRPWDLGSVSECPYQRFEILGDLKINKNKGLKNSFFIYKNYVVFLYRVEIKNMSQEQILQLIYF
jgi:hypothetical protein